MKNTLEKYQIIIYLVLVVMIMTVVKVKYGVVEENPKTKNQKPTNTPTVVMLKPTSPAVTPTIDVSDDYPLWRQLPYSGDGFTVDKYTAPMTLQMTITTATSTAASNAIKEWINSFPEIKRQHKIILVNQSLNPTHPGVTPGSSLSP